MNSIFEKPSILGFRQEGGRIAIQRHPNSSIIFTNPKDAERYTKSAGDDWVDIPAGDPRYDALERAAGSGDITSALNPTQWAQAGKSSVDFIPGLTQDYGQWVQGESMPRAKRVAGDRAAIDKLVEKGLIEKVNDISQPGAPTPTYRVRKSVLDGSIDLPALLAGGDLPASPAAPAAPTASMFVGPPSFLDNSYQSFGPPAALANDYEGFGPPAALANRQPATGTREERIAAAKQSGDFDAKRAQYNQDAQRMGHPTMMDEDGNIVGRELSLGEQMQNFARQTGGNTPFMQTNDPAQRAMQNETLAQARRYNAANAFGTTDEERLANLEQETEARRILATPLGDQVREIAPGVRMALKDGQVVGSAVPRAANAPPGMMNDPLQKYTTNAQGQVVLNRNPRQVGISDYMGDQVKFVQTPQGITGGTPAERALIAETEANIAKQQAAAAAAAPAPAAAAAAPAPAPASGMSPNPINSGLDRDFNNWLARQPAAAPAVKAKALMGGGAMAKEGGRMSAMERAKAKALAATNR
jgi:hypothetical protein